METMEYIDSYFQQTMSEAERLVFEKRCEEDKAFAQEVAFYITARQSLREELLKQKQTSWITKHISIIDELPFIPKLKKSLASRWVTYLAAACIVLVASVYIFETNPSPKKLAETYIKANYTNLSLSMDASRDSLQLGIDAYNNKQYDKALTYFSGVEKKDAANSDAKKYAGLTYIQKDEYDSALMQFDALSNMKGLFSNAGDFLKAVSLMARNKPGDKKEAKQLLKKVIAEKEEGSDKATEWERKL